MINSKAKGNAYEVKIAQELRELGYASALTSRYASRALDDLKSDIANVPFHAQLKNTAKPVNVHNCLAEMPKDKPRYLFNKITRKGEYVTMTKDQFYELLQKLKYFEDIWVEEAISE